MIGVRWVLQRRIAVEKLNLNCDREGHAARERSAVTVRR
jgi:hypothetical protein